MARNGSGGYSLPVNTWNPATNGVSATAADWQALINDVAAAVQQSISADGQTPITGSLNMGGNRLTSLAAGTATGHSLRFEQLFSQGLSADVAAATTVDIGAQLSTLINVTGSGTITSFGTNYNGPRFIRFAGVCTLTNGASLVLPGGANITTAAGDSAIAVPLGNPATGWIVAGYQRASGQALVSSTDFLNTTRIDVASGATVDLTASAPNTRHINITGTTTITAFTVAIGQTYFVRFAGALTLTNNASIVTQSGANITTQAGDTCIIRSTSANTVEVLSYREGRIQSQPGDAPLYGARAWVNFNGTGTVAIRASGNVTSITDNGVGDYTVNFTTAFADTNYTPTALINGGSFGSVTQGFGTTAPTTSAYRFGSRRTDTFAAGDAEYCALAFFR